MDQFGRNEVPGTPTVVDGVRDFPMTYEVIGATGQPVSTVPAGRWSRAELVRASQPTFALPPMVPAYDRTRLGPPSDWTRVNS